MPCAEEKIEEVVKENTKVQDTKGELKNADKAKGEEIEKYIRKPM